MEQFFTNSGLLLIGENILDFLDHEDLMTCRIVCRIFKKSLDNIRFWMKKCSRKMRNNTRNTVFQLRNEQIRNEWINFSKRIIGTNHEYNFLKMLMVIHKGAETLKLQTPLLMASRLGNLALVQDMLDHMNKSRIQEQFDLFNRENWQTPLHEAAQHGHIEIVKLFIPFTYAKNIPLEDHRGNTPFDLAAKEGHTDIAKLLLRQMIDNSKMTEREMHDYLKFLHHTYTVDGRHDIASLILGPNHLQH